MSNITAGAPDSPVNAKNAILWKAYERAPMTNIKVKDVTVYGVQNAISLSNVKDFELHNVKISLVSNTSELVTYNTEAIEISDVKLYAGGKEYDLAEGSKLIMQDDFDKNNPVLITGTITTDDKNFAEGKASVNAFLDCGTLEPGNKAPVITPYAAEIKKATDGKYFFSANPNIHSLSCILASC